MTNILFTLILALGIKIVDLTVSPKYYLITYQDGQREQVVITKSNNICPNYCEADHPHSVNMCEGDCKHINQSFIITKQIDNDNNTFNLYCKGKEILLFQEIEKNGNYKKKKPNSMKIF